MVTDSLVLAQMAAEMNFVLPFEVSLACLKDFEVIVTFLKDHRNLADY